MSLVKAKKAREKRANILGQMKDLHKKNKGKLAKEDEQRWAKLDKESENLRKQAERHERMAELESKQKETRHIKIDKGGNPDKDKDDKEKRSEKYDKVFHRYMQHQELSKEDRQILLGGEKRDNTVNGDGTQGGYLVPQGFSNELEKVMKWYGGMMEVAHVMNTATGNDLLWPMLDDKDNVGAIIGETVDDTKQSLAFTNKIIKSYTYSSKMLPVSMELLQDSYFALQGIITEAGGERLGRITNSHFTNGTGINQPEGVVTASSLGVTAGSATALARNNFVDLVHSVDRAYRKSPNCQFMFHDTTLAAIKKMAFGTGDDRPLWQTSVKVGEPDRLEGYAYTVNNDMPEIATGAKSVLFGDFKKYKIRQVRTAELVVSTEKLVGQRMTVFYIFSRYDGKLININAVKHLKQA